jgi:hypothetical protein
VPKVFEPVRCQLGVPHRVLNVSVPEPSLQRPGVVAGVREGVAAAMLQHVRMYRELHLGPSPDHNRALAKTGPPPRPLAGLGKKAEPVIIRRR